MSGPECWVIGSMAIAVSWSGHLIGTVAEITDPQAVVSAGARIVLSTSNCTRQHTVSLKQAMNGAIKCRKMKRKAYANS